MNLPDSFTLPQPPPGGGDTLARLIVNLYARAELAEAEAAALRARVAELEEHLTGDIQAVTSDGQQHRIRRGNWRPYPASLLE